MPNETGLQAEIRKSVKAQGGYCHKLTNRFTIGIPDLLIALPPFAPCIVEVKDLGECGAVFNRQLDVTPKQRYELTAMSECYGLTGLVRLDVSFLLVGFTTKKERWIDDPSERRGATSRPPRARGSSVSEAAGRGQLGHTGFNDEPRQHSEAGMSFGQKIVDERTQIRGAFTEQALVSQNLKMTLRARPSKFEGLSTVQKEALDQIQAKIARILTGDPDEIDAWGDISGYAELICRNLKAQGLKTLAKGV